MHLRAGLPRIVVALIFVSGSIFAPAGSRGTGGDGPIVDGPASESQPSATSRYLAWIHGPKDHPRRSIVYARGDGGRFRVSRRGARAGTVGGAIDGSTLVYTERKGGPNADIKFFNLRTKKRRNGPGPVNTPKHEWGASLSGRWLLFVREVGSVRRILLYNRRNSNLRELDRRRTTRNSLVQPGNVAGHFATWIDCPSFRKCRVIRLNIRSGKRTRMPNPKSRSQYAPSVTPDGAVFFVESQNIATCNSPVKMFRKPPSADRKKLLNLPDGTDTAILDAVGKKGKSIVYDLVNCNTRSGDIYRLTR